MGRLTFTYSPQVPFMLADAMPKIFQDFYIFIKGEFYDKQLLLLWWYGNKISLCLNCNFDDITEI